MGLCSCIKAEDEVPCVMLEIESVFKEIWSDSFGLLIPFLMGFKCKSIFFISLFPSSMLSLLLLLWTFTRQSLYKDISSHHTSSWFPQWNLASAETHDLHSLLFHWYHHYTAFTFWVEGWTSVVSILLVILIWIYEIQFLTHCRVSDTFWYFIALTRVFV